MTSTHSLDWMQPRVTVILVARNGADFLDRTLSALSAQSRRPDAVMFVDAGSTDATTAMLAAAGPTQLITTPSPTTFGGGVTAALRVAAPIESENDWIWLLAHDSAPEPRALEALLGAVEIAPSVAVAGPKLMRWNEPDVIAEFGETITPLGSTIALVENELDQAQHDSRSDIMAVAATGMLVRRTDWAALGGFDPGLPTVDAALDFCLRARLAGHRVVGVPAARVLTSGGPELFGRRTVSAASLARQRRSAQLRRRLVYAPLAVVPVHWLLMVPLAVLRSIGHLLGKRPGAIGGEFVAAFATAFSGGIPAARSRLARSRRLRWSAVSPLRMPWRDVREHRAHQREITTMPAAQPQVQRERVSFLSGGGAWIVLFVLAASVIVWGGLLGAGSVVGGGLAPLSSSVAHLWANLGYGWRDLASGFTGPADPFTYVVAVLGSITFWSPSLSIVWLYLAAMPLAALGAWWCAARFATRAWAPAVAAVLWAVAPPFLASLGEGRLGAVIAHLLLPWLVLAAANAARSWAAASTAALLFAVVAASAPSLIPAMLIAWVILLVSRPTGAHRLAGVPIPAAALFVPVVLWQIAAGRPLAIFADPGVPAVAATPSGWQLAIGSAGTGYNEWTAGTSALGIDPSLAPLVAAILVAPIAVIALLAVFLPGALRAVPALVVALLGFATALVGSHVAVTIIGDEVTTIWPGAGLSLYWLGLVAAIISALEAIRRFAAMPGLILAVAATAAALPLLAAPLVGQTAVGAGTGRMLPAFVTAEAATNPGHGTLEIVPLKDGAIRAVLHRGDGTTLDEQSTLESTRSTTDAADERLATLAGNLASRSGFDSAPELAELQIGFVLLAQPSDSAATAAAAEKASEALDGNRLLTPIGTTSQGFLWRYLDLPAGEAPTGPGPLDSTLGIVILATQASVVGAALLLAIPTRRRRRVRTTRADSSRPATTFDEGFGDPDD